MQKELKELNADEKERQETELKAAKERRKAVEDLERGVHFVPVFDYICYLVRTTVMQIDVHAFSHKFQNYLEKIDRKIQFTAEFRKVACFQFQVSHFISC